MAESIVKYRGAGDWQQLTLPYTAQSNGVFFMTLAPTTSSGAYVYCLINGVRISLASTGGGRQTTSYFVKKGETISLETSSSNAGAGYRFLPFYF